MGSVFCGSQLKLSVFGESHGQAIGMVLDGFPSGMAVDMELIKRQLERRRPNAAAYSTKRKEPDEPKVLSGIASGVICGSPICMAIENLDARPGDYKTDVFRPSHADYTGYIRYKGHNDAAGGGHFSGRLTAPLVMAGALCRQYLKEKFGVEIFGRIKSIGGVNDRELEYEKGQIKGLEQLSGKDFPMLDEKAGQQMLELIQKAASSGDSLGGTVECVAVGVKAGLGSPNMWGVESRLAALLFAIPAVKALEFGSGFEMCGMRGSEANDAFAFDEKVYTLTNHNGGILGGITSGMPITFTVGIKPTPSIALPQRTINNRFESVEHKIKGRHDPCIVPRAVPAVEAAAAIALLDLYLEAVGYEGA
ncbi:MAG: chorismate synthase [Clostridiales bacterium]|jgi:chorismate synthase|nr:chorismate synthase [Clostridiales bacterium]